MPEDIQSSTTNTNITYTVGDYVEGDRSVEVTYTNEEGFVYKRMVNIPYLKIEEGESSIDESYFEEILESQLMGITNNAKIQLITFTDPNAPVDPIEETETLNIVPPE